MTLKDLVVFVDDYSASERRCDLAVRLARRHGAHLAGVHLMPLGEAAPRLRNARYDSIHRMLEESGKQRAADAERIFRAALAREGATGEWRFARVDYIHHGIVHARHADLAIVGQIAPDDHVMLVPEMAPEEVMLTAGRPVLVVPHAGDFTRLGERVVVAWNAGREAARAVNDAMPLLTMAQSVTVLCVNPQTGVARHGDAPGADIAVHLARHGVKVTVERSHASELDVADVLLNRVADLGADLVVAGGYGRSRIRELILGGTTRDLLRHMTVPIFMSH
jgi:nucleotide-binding universal stress UspA family protein